VRYATGPPRGGADAPYGLAGKNRVAVFIDAVTRSTTCVVLPAFQKKIGALGPDLLVTGKLL
jgi:hypothetical protein